jgi:hypothetical protein
MDGETVDLGMEATDTEVQSQDTEVNDQQGSEQNAGEVQAQTPGEGQGAEDQTQIDGRRGPSNIRSSIKAASEALPEQAAAFKELGNAYFRDQAYKQVFPTPQEAASAKQLLEGIGGVEGASTLQSRAQEYESQESAIQAGDPSVLDAFFKDYPQQASGMASAYLERVAEANPTALSEAVAPYAIEMVINAGLADTLKDAFNADDPKPLIEKMYNWLAQQNQATKQLRVNGGAKAPGADRLTQEREQLHQEREQIFKSSVSERVNSLVDPQIASQVDRYSKQYKLNETQRDHYRKTLQNVVIEAMNSDKTYMKQVDLRYANKSRSRESVATYIAGEFNRRMSEKAFEVIKGIYGAPRGGSSPAQSGQVKAGQPQSAPGGGPLRISYIPGNEQLDTSRPNFDLMRIQGRGYLKGSGRFVTWSHLRG